jgi:hypothetical protein
MYIGCWLGNLRERDHLEWKPRRRWEDNIKQNFRKCDVGTWTRSIGLRIGTGGRHL